MATPGKDNSLESKVKNPRGWMLCVLIPVLAAAMASAAESRQTADSRPNILFVFTDDHSTRAVSAYGSKINLTPNIDRLAREGMIFRNSFVTNSICAPSRAVILTGKHSHLNGVIDNRTVFDGSQQTLPKLLQRRGYQTAVIGKWHLRSDPTGFDHWEVLDGAGEQGFYYNPVFRTPQGLAEHTGYTTRIITDRALKWLNQGRDPNRPFLLMYQHKAPHRDWAPGPDQLTLYDDRQIPEPDTLFDDYSGRTLAAHFQEMTISHHMTETDLKLRPPFNLTPQQLRSWNAAYGPKNRAFVEAGLSGRELVRWKYQRYIKDYLRSVAAVDDQLGRILDYLDKTGLAGNTVVIYNSDQGFYLGEHGWFDKRFMYKESFKTPLIVRWPGVIEPGSEDQNLVLNLDYTPTFLEIAGADVPEDLQGESLIPLFRQQPNSWRESIYYHYYEFPAVHRVFRHYGVRTARYKLIHFYDFGQWELFDLEQDPKELHSVYNDPEYGSAQEELKRELSRLRDHYRVPEVDPDRAAGYLR